jgi:hypothetical protein
MIARARDLEVFGGPDRQSRSRLGLGMHIHVIANRHRQCRRQGEPSHAKEEGYAPGHVSSCENTMFNPI